jgi:hypothetical protein
MNKLESRIYEAVLLNGGAVVFQSTRDKMVREVYNIAIEEIKEAFEEGFLDGGQNALQPNCAQIYSSGAFNDYIKQKGYE